MADSMQVQDNPVGRGRGRGRGNNANRKNFSNNLRGRTQFHMMNSSDFPIDIPHENNTISGFEENHEELISSQNQTPKIKIPRPRCCEYIYFGYHTRPYLVVLLV